jgi:hypothetical protein
MENLFDFEVKLNIFENKRKKSIISLKENLRN